MSQLTALELLERLAIALAIGLFIGLEREYARHAGGSRGAAGVRTFAIIGLLGGVSAYLADVTTVWVLPAMLLALTLMQAVSYAVVARATGGKHLGQTTEMVALLVFALGAAVYHGAYVVAGATAAATAMLLSAKAPLHEFAGRLSTEDWVATLKFAAVTLIVLPILPNQEMGPFGAFNPFRIWLMVVLIAGIGFMGYALSKVVGVEHGLPLSGAIGGLASSTAVVLSNSRRSRQMPRLAELLALGVVIACTIMLPRVAIIIAAVQYPLLRWLVWPLSAMLVVSAAYLWFLWRKAGGHYGEEAKEKEEPEYTNPFELGSALKFAAVFALVSLLVRWVQSTGAGQGGVYVVSLLSGLLDVNAITLSLAQQSGNGLDPTVAARGVVIGLVANTLLKGVFAVAAGERRFGRLTVLGLLLTAIVGIGVAFLAL